MGKRRNKIYLKNVGEVTQVKNITDMEKFEPYYPAPYEEEVRYLTYDEFHKLNRVQKWAKLDNPVRGTCWRCGYEGLVDDPEVGIY